MTHEPRAADHEPIAGRRRSYATALAALLAACGGDITMPPVTTKNLTVVATGGGTGKVMLSNPPSTDCPLPCDRVYETGTALMLTASADPGSSFLGWAGDCSGAAQTCALTLDDSRRVTAAFQLDRPPVTVEKLGAGAGTVTSTPAGIRCGPTCVATFRVGDRITLRATPAAGSRFAGWNGGCTAASGDCAFEIDGARTVIARFEAGCQARPELCNGLDDNCDGQIDEGFVYQTIPASVQTLTDSGTVTQIGSVAVGDDRAAFVWFTGNGDRRDVVRVQVTDLEGRPAGDRQSIGRFQSSDDNQVVWAGDRFLVTGTTRWYDCPGSPRTTCTTYLFGVGRDGSMVTPLTALFAGGKVDTAIAAGGELLLQLRPTATAAPQARSFTTPGLPGRVSRTLTAPAPGTAWAAPFHAVRTSSATLAWLTDVQGATSSTSVTLGFFETRDDGTPIGGVHLLAGRASGVGAPSSVPAAMIGGVLHVAFVDGSTLAMGRWTRDGTFLGRRDVQFGVDESVLTFVFDGGGQVLLLTLADKTLRLVRLSPSGTLLQPLTVVGGALGAVAAAVPGGLLVGGSDYTGRHVFWQRVGCP